MSAPQRPRRSSGASPAIPPLDLVTFGGETTEDVTIFLQNVARVAFAQGRQSDDEWLLSYAETCLTGRALRWFCDLDENVSRSWKALRKAFLTTYRPVSESSSLLPPVAVPAAAAPPGASKRQPEGEVNWPAPPLPSQISAQGADKSVDTKALILGDSGVGKSCLMSRYLGHGWTSGRFPPVRYEIWNVRMLKTTKNFTHGNVYQEHMWKIPGAPDYKSLVIRHVPGITQVFLVYDLTNRKSFDQLKDWQGLISKYANQLISKYLVANKCDARESRRVSKEEGERMAQEWGATYVETSAVTNEGVDWLRGAGQWWPAWA